MTSQEIVRAVSFARAAFLRDSTPIDFCGLPQLFDRRGELLADARQLPPRYRRLEECHQSIQDPTVFPRVVVHSVRMTADTLVVSGFTDRGWITLVEEYLLHRVRDVRQPVVRYRIVGFVER
jgi:hypothetical protein